MLILILIFQNIFWKKTKSLRAELEVVPNAYNETTMRAFLFGDGEYYFRLKGLKVQNMGDTFGRSVALYKYDYKKLYDWFNALDKLNVESNYLAALSAYYFSQTQNIPDRRFVVNFLVKHGERNPAKKWWWLYQAAYIARYFLKDAKLSMEIANKLKDLPNREIPFWIRHATALYLIEGGQECEGWRIIGEMEKEYGNLDEEKDPEIIKRKEIELNYMGYFIKNILDKFKKEGLDRSKCLNLK
ncbi:MAG: hypothetical protein LBB09_00855 [Rickettsiales bacterium]|jgi:hypothetical protein|nr:hypothetical protein [Rickettsiales bacterium]